MALLENGIGENHLIVDQEGASPARNGRYVNQIGNPKLRQFNQYIRNKRLPPGRLWWRTRDTGHFNIKR